MPCTHNLAYLCTWVKAMMSASTCIRRQSVLGLCSVMSDTHANCSRFGGLVERPSCRGHACTTDLSQHVDELLPVLGIASHESMRYSR